MTQGEQADAPSPQDVWLDHLGEADRYLDWLASMVIPHLDGRVLEVGCGTGSLTRLAAPFVDEITGIDIDPAYVRYAGAQLCNVKNASTAVSNVFDYNPSTSFDTVMALDVMEHIEDETAFLQQMRSLIHENGRLVLKVPAMPSLYNSLDRAVGHFRRYSSHSLRRALNQAGFTIKTMKPFNIVGMLGWWLNGNVLKREHSTAEQIKSFDTLVPLLRVIERLPMPVGLSLVAVADVTQEP